MKERIWFDRKFDFSVTDNEFQKTFRRISATSRRLQLLIDGIPEDFYRVQIQQTWSIKQNIGHLWDLEPLWFGRIYDIMNDVKTMRAADLENRKTHEANHNEQSIENLIQNFTKNRKKLIDELKKLSDEDIIKTSNHPRLNQPMRMKDLLYFVAEHDDHHLDRIEEISLILETKIYKEHN